MTDERIIRVTKERYDQLDHLLVEAGEREELPEDDDFWGKVDWDKLESSPRPRLEVVGYIQAITHQPCSCTHCQTRKQILLWAFPGIEKEVKQ